MTFLECGGGWECNEVVPCPLGRAILTHANIWVSICASTESVSGELSWALLVTGTLSLLGPNTDLQMCFFFLNSVWDHSPSFPRRISTRRSFIQRLCTKNPQQPMRIPAPHLPETGKNFREITGRFLGHMINPVWTGPGRAHMA